jgi:hypothetical protein
VNHLLPFGTQLELFQVSRYPGLSLGIHLQYGIELFWQLPHLLFEMVNFFTARREIRDER